MTVSATAPTGYGPIYAAATVVAFALTFLPPYRMRERDGITTTYGNIWEDFDQGAGPAAVMLIGALAFLLMYANFRPPQHVGVPIGIAVLSALGILMIATKPSTGSPKPQLAEGGLGLLGVCITVLCVGIAHAIHVATGPRHPAAAPGEPR